ncbi:MAG: HYR domain-containing protein, partial [Saprospiraceae bacterium]|nr:HYR domain-containing protein [Saprospiraceae bacterium]
MKQILLLILSVTSLHISVTANPHNHTFPVTALMDPIPPVIQCPASATITLGNFQCDTVLNFTVTATDDAGPVILTQTSGPASGTAFPIGINTCVFLATDLA